MKKGVRIGIAAAIAAAVGVVAYGHTLKCVSYEIKDERLTAPVKIAFLSDVHGSLYGSGQSELVQKIADYGADLVMFGGDLFDEKHDPENSWTLVDALAGEYPCFYAAGNHEAKHGRLEYYKEEMAKHGVTVLSGDTRRIEVNGQILRICGADGFYDGTLESVREELDDAYSILLYHFPEDFPQTSQMGFDLILAGHAHGGQWRIPGLLNGLYAPGEGLFPKYAGGRYEQGNTVMLVSRGLYRHIDCAVIPRIFNHPELLLITIGG